MSQRNRKLRVLIAKPGLDGHDVGAKIVVRALMDAGLEVIYTGLRNSPAEIAAAARDEDVDVIGLSILSGSHLPLCRELVQKLAAMGIGKKLLLVGGNIPRQDHRPLKELGVDGIFPFGTPLEDIVDFINQSTE